VPDVADENPPKDAPRDAGKRAGRGEPSRGDATMGRIANLAGGWSVDEGDDGGGGGDDESEDAQRDDDAGAGSGAPRPPPPPPPHGRGAPPPPPHKKPGDSERRVPLPPPAGARPAAGAEVAGSGGARAGAKASVDPAPSVAASTSAAVAALGAPVAPSPPSASTSTSVAAPSAASHGSPVAAAAATSATPPVAGPAASTRQVWPAPLAAGKPEEPSLAPVAPPAPVASPIAAAPNPTAARAGSLVVDLDDDPDAIDVTFAPEPSRGEARRASATPAAGSERAGVPLGEFDEPHRRRKGADARGVHDQVVAVTVAATAERGDATMIDATHQRTDETEIRAAGPQVADAGIAATLRHAPSLPRRRGLWGDMRYVFTVWLGGRRARREIATLEREQLERESTRRRHLTAIGRSAATAAELDQTQIRRVRDTIAAIDQERSKQASQVGASDEEMETVRRERAAKATAHRDETEALDLEQAQLLQKLEPMQREAATARRKATDLRNALTKLDERIRNVEAGRGKWADSATQAAELAALRAERQGVARDEPIIAAQLDSLVPRIASIEATRERLRRKVLERNEEEEEDRKRCEELLTAIAAKRKVVDRATADAEKARERMLAELGERLYVDRPADLSARLGPIDSLDLELGAGQRRIMELKEILASVDRWKVARGLVWWTVVLAALGAGAWLYLQGRLPFLPPPS
jgi:hypothetical protein